MMIQALLFHAGCRSVKTFLHCIPSIPELRGMMENGFVYNMMTDAAARFAMTSVVTAWNAALNAWEWELVAAEQGKVAPASKRGQTSSF